MALPLIKTETNEADADCVGPEAPRGEVPASAVVAVPSGAALRVGEVVEPAAADASDAPLTAFRYRATVLRQYRAVYRFAAALVRVDADAEDVTQETFLRYWQHGQTVRRPREWLFRVARNLCLDRLRRAGRIVSTEVEPGSEPAEERGPAWQYDRAELGSRLARLVDGLPEPQRSLVVLFDVQGMSGEECARVIGLNVNQVKVYLHRARKRLRQKLEEA